MYIAVMVKTHLNFGHRGSIYSLQHQLGNPVTLPYCRE